MFYQIQSLYFECTGCSKCCTGTDDHYINVNDNEQQRIQSYLGLSKNWFRRRYLRKLDARITSLVIEKGACVFLVNNRCRIYSVRPAQCKSYPFWPEILHHKSTWNNEKKHCEGIDRGPKVPVAKIKQYLANSTD